MNQSNLLINIVGFNNKPRPRKIVGKGKKEITMKVDILFMQVEK